MSDLSPVESFAAGLIQAMAPDARKGLAKELARRLQASQSKRITLQKNPDGTDFEPRKPQLRHQKGKIRRRMFDKLRTTRFLKAEGTPEAALVRFTDNVQRIARVHQGGLRDRVNRAGLEAKYPARRLLGISADDEAIIEDVTTAWLADRL